VQPQVLGEPLLFDLRDHFAMLIWMEAIDHDAVQSSDGLHSFTAALTEFEERLGRLETRYRVTQNW
jgi:hypothetical protein